VHHEVLGGEFLVEGVEIEGGERIDKEHFAFHEKLQEADFRAVAVHVIGFGIERDFVGLVEGIKQRLELTGLVDELVFRGIGFHGDAEQTASGARKKAFYHE